MSIFTHIQNIKAAKTSLNLRLENRSQLKPQPLFTKNADVSDPLSLLEQSMVQQLSGALANITSQDSYSTASQDAGLKTINPDDVVVDGEYIDTSHPPTS